MLPHKRHFIGSIQGYIPISLFLSLFSIWPSVNNADNSRMFSIYGVGSLLSEYKGPVQSLNADCESSTFETKELQIYLHAEVVFVWF